MSGTGTNLRVMLKLVGITDKSNCRCEAFAKFLDEVGKKWCEVHFKDIINELKNRSQEYNYPWSDLGAKVMLRVAIKLADK